MKEWVTDRRKQWRAYTVIVNYLGYLAFYMSKKIKSYFHYVIKYLVYQAKDLAWGEIFGFKINI